MIGPVPMYQGDSHMTRSFARTTAPVRDDDVVSCSFQERFESLSQESGVIGEDDAHTVRFRGLRGRTASRTPNADPSDGEGGAAASDSRMRRCTRARVHRWQRRAHGR